MRRIVLAVVVVVAIVLIAVLVNSCEVNARNSALEDYNNSVASLNGQSVNTGTNFFNALTGPTTDPTALQHTLNTTANDAASELSKAKGISTPDEVKGAQQDFVTALQMRADGIRNIAAQIQPALQSQTAKDAVNTIAAEMAQFYASDVLYKSYAVPQIIGALRGAGIPVGGLGGQQVNSSQFLTSIDWLNPTEVAKALHVSLPTPARQQADRAGPPRPPAELGQRGRNHAADRAPPTDPGQPGADLHAQLRQHRPEHRDQREVQGHRSPARTSAGRRSCPRPPTGESTQLPGDAHQHPAQGLPPGHRDDRARARREDHVEQLA